MSIMIILILLLIPACMLVGSWMFISCRIWFHILAMVSAYVFGIISALAVNDILRDDTVFMTNIHGVFNNQLFLLSGGYLGCYGIYLMWKRLLIEIRKE
ncbi:transposase [Paenibacillus sp. P36]|uniref:transposase n=1 Tax=Paenibacillus sp. P36 TaxID=3342538 RepID=UPI0038B33531